MKRIATLICVLAMAACTHTLPKPTNANGSFNPSVAMAEAELSYASAAHAAAAFIGQCRVAATTPGCSEQRIQQIKVADQKAYDALQNAERAVKALPPGITGGDGIDKAIAALNAALIFLQGFLPGPAH